MVDPRVRETDTSQRKRKAPVRVEIRIGHGRIE